MPDQNSCPTLRSLLCKLHKIIYRYFTPSHIEPLDRFEIYNYNKIVDNRHQSVSVQALKRCVVPVCGTRGALSWLYGSQKLVTKTFNGSFTSVGEPFSLLSTDWRSNMIEDSILKCLTSFSKLLDTRYIMHLGRAGKTVSFEIGFTKHDCYHLMGLHYLKDRRDNRGRNYIFDELLASADARKHIFFLVSRRNTFSITQLIIGKYLFSLITAKIQMNGSAVLYSQRHLAIMLSVKQGGLFCTKRNYYQMALKPYFTTTKDIALSDNLIIKKNKMLKKAVIFAILLRIILIFLT